MTSWYQNVLVCLQTFNCFINLKKKTSSDTTHNFEKEVSFASNIFRNVHSIRFSIIETVYMKKKILKNWTKKFQLCTRQDVGRLYMGTSKDRRMDITSHILLIKLCNSFLGKTFVHNFMSKLIYTSYFINANQFEKSWKFDKLLNVLWSFFYSVENLTWNFLSLLWNL